MLSVFLTVIATGYALNYAKNQTFSPGLRKFALGVTGGFCHDGD